MGLGNVYLTGFMTLAALGGVIGGVVYLDGGPSTGDQEDFQNVSLDIEMSGDRPSPGEVRSLTVSADGRPVSGVELEVDGVVVAETGPNGTADVSIPRQDSLVVDAFFENFTAQKTFDIDYTQDSSGGDESGGADDSSSDSSDGGSDDGSGSGSDTGDGSGSGGSDSEGQEVSSENYTIERVEPLDDNLTDRFVNFKWEVDGPEASYRVFLNGAEQDSGSFDGETTVKTMLELSNGSNAIEFRIRRDSKVMEAASTSVNHYQDPTENERNETEVSLEASISMSGERRAGEVLEFSATSNAESVNNYTWSFGEGGEEVTQSSTVSHNYSQPGNYTVDLSVNAEQGVVSASRSFEVTPVEEPRIIFDSPQEGAEASGGFIEYDFTVEEVPSGSTYRIYIDGEEVLESSLPETNEVQRSVSTPENSFTTYVEVVKDGEEYTSGERQVSVAQESSEAQFYLNEPYDGKEIVLTSSGQEIQLSYEVVEKGSYSSGSVEVTSDSGTAYSNSFSLEEKIYSNNIQLDEDNYTVELSLGDGAVSKSNQFEVVSGQSATDVTLVKPDDGIKLSESNYTSSDQTVFGLDYEAGSDGTLWFEIIAKEATKNDSTSDDNTTDDGSGGDDDGSTGGDDGTTDDGSTDDNTTDDGSDDGGTVPEYKAGEQVVNKSISVLEGMSETQEFTHTFYANTVYKWRGWITVNGEEVASSEFRTVNVTQE